MKDLKRASEMYKLDLNERTKDRENGAWIMLRWSLCMIFMEMVSLACKNFTQWSSRTINQMSIIFPYPNISHMYTSSEHFQTFDARPTYIHIHIIFYYYTGLLATVTYIKQEIEDDWSNRSEIANHLWHSQNKIAILQSRMNWYNPFNPTIFGLSSCTMYHGSILSNQDLTTEEFQSLR